jgi:UDP-N-acetylmuramoyl-L-alanyl-D-glutamate--2,6-diaminopimelate ligase
MKLSALLASLPHASPTGNTEVDVRAITSDSRRVQPGDLFVAYPGIAVDGRQYIKDAINKGAAAVVIEGDTEKPREIRENQSTPFSANFPVIVVPDGREALAWLAAAWNEYPSRKLKVIGVTGTDGKTTTSSLISSILQTAGLETGLISTVAAYIGEKALDTGFHTTTPDAPELQAYLAQMVTAGAQYAVVESTSLGLAQKRLAGVDYDVAVVTNITHEHLNDHHDSFDEYRSAKRMLFESLLSGARKPGTPKVSVLNADDSSYEFLRATPADSHLSYGIHNVADVRATDITHSPDGLVFTAQMPTGPLAITSPLLGVYNVSNILAALCVAHSQGVSPQFMQEGVQRVRSVPGRMERIDRGQPFTVIVDFAHTPNALESALKTARSLTSKRVIVVFGCAGLRDVRKRPMMGEVAGRLADQVVITAEDPRTEPLHKIMQQIDGGVQEAKGNSVMVADRQEAIAFAIKHAQPGDLVIVTGKGHERSMCFGTTETPWSDQDAVMRVLDVQA